VTDPAINAFPHRFMPAAAPEALTLLLLHGTGGDESDLFELGRALDPDSALLSPRGHVSEHGANRWFRRLAEGVFDIDDLLARTDELAAFVGDAVDHLCRRPRTPLPEPVCRGDIARQSEPGAFLLGSDGFRLH
jgi:predicted esterase